MAAYAALVSLVHVIEQIQHHPRPPFYLDNEHAQCLIEKVTSLQGFLELYSHVRNEEVERLESRIAEAAYAAEDLIETHVVDQILAQSAQHGRRICSADFHQNLQKVIQDMDFIKEEVMKIKEWMGSVKDFQQHRRSLMLEADSSRSPPPVQNTMVGRDDVLEHIIRDKLTLKQHSNLQVIPIVGMGGIGKTTVAKNVYEHPTIVQHFYVRLWITISQVYSVRKILLELLLCLDNQESPESLSKKKEVELRDRLYKSLYSKTYLIILDDMWQIEAWDKIKSSFPNNNKGSRVIITTRQSNMALDLTSGRGDNIIEMKFLNDDISWNLLCKIVFGSEDDCPSELKEIGGKIASNCEGLPLAIVAIGGLLAKSEKTLEYWEYIAENSHSLEENEHCLSVLHTSYNHLPIHLKPCFLYMVSFEEDAEINVQALIWLWVVEGFLKPVREKSLEAVATEYLNDLIDRNLILAVKRNQNGTVKSCKLHDLLRELCLRESQKDKFFLVTRHHSLNNYLHGLNTHRRVFMYVDTSKGENQCYFPDEICDALQSASLVRTLVCNTVEVLPSPNLSMLRILVFDQNSKYYEGDEYFLANYGCLVNLRALLAEQIDVMSHLSSSIHLFWNLQMLLIREAKVKYFDIWQMPLLRLVLMGEIHLKNPGQNDFVLRNLYLLGVVTNFRCDEEVIKRIPNVKVLSISYDEEFIGSHYCLNNLSHLHKLEEVQCKFEKMPSRSELVQNLTFPQCLKELILEGCCLHWEDISTKIGSLPLLQVLKLREVSFIEPEWETIEGEFCSLKILKIQNCSGLKCWKTESSHFPCLELLVLKSLHELEEIPSAVGDISTLQLIKIRLCSYSAVVSAKEIAKEQEELENQDLHVRVKVYSEEYEEIKSWASLNFEVQMKKKAIAATLDDWSVADL